MAEPGTRNARCDEPAPFGQRNAGAIMSKFQQSLKVLAVVIGIGTLSACGSVTPVPVAKVDFFAFATLLYASGAAGVRPFHGGVAGG